MIKCRSFGSCVQPLYTPDAVRSQLSILAEKFHKPGENHLTDGYIVTERTKQLLQTHLQETGGKVITRFPPEPNGFLHIGHAMAMNFSFSYASAHKGITYLRYDDTNPVTMQEMFVKDIQDMVEWLGYEPYKTTFASDYFEQLYEYAKELIQRGHAYVCHQPQDNSSRDDRLVLPQNSPWRDRPTSKSLELFEDMRKGKFKEGEATLRMKVRLADGKQDPVAYRIKTTPHPRTRDQWSIYPMYDFSHCLCDSIENITHSFCSKEFMVKRSSYYWLCNALDVYCPVQWEFSRLNVTNTILSKRKIQKLIDTNLIQDWDDPRLHTLSGLRRRGFPPEAIRAYCDQYGVLQTVAEVDVKMVDHYVRKHLNETATRAMAVIDPIKVVITNFPWPENHVVQAPNNPNDPSSGTRSLPFNRIAYIERTDFREDCPKGYNRLTPNQPVGLKYTHSTIQLEKVVRDPVTDQPMELHVLCHPHKDGKPATVKPKAYIHWVCNPLPCTLRFYQERTSGEIVPGSLKQVDALVEECLKSSREGSRFQFERVGYFSVDPDSTQDKLVFNNTLGLKVKVDLKWPVVPNYFHS